MTWQERILKDVRLVSFIVGPILLLRTAMPFFRNTHWTWNASFQWLLLRYGIINIEVIQAAIQVAKQEGLLVSLDLASFEVQVSGLVCFS